MRILLPLLLLLNLSMKAQSISEMIHEINSLAPENRQSAVERFMEANPVFPVFDKDSSVYFVLRGDARKVELAGDMTNWKPDFSFNHIGNTDFWYLSRIYEPDARLDYKFVIDGKIWFNDPLNPYTCVSGYGINSELRMPGYPPQPEITKNDDIPRGTFSDTSFFSQILKNERLIRVYFPPDYSVSGESYPLLIIHDGLEFIDIIRANVIFDNLIATHKVQPFIAAFVQPVERDSEYAGSLKDDYTAFISEELLPYIDQKFRTLKQPENRALCGISNGGNIALYIAMKHPGIFGKTGALSSNVIREIQQDFVKESTRKLQVYLDIGTYDIPELIVLVRKLHHTLDSKGYNVLYHEWHEGHSWGNWQAHLDEMLKFFFPPEK